MKRKSFLEAVDALSTQKFAYGALLLTAVCFAFFWVFAGIDIAISSWFFDDAREPHWLGRSPVLWWIRNRYYDASYIVVIGSVLIYFASRWVKTEVQTRIYGFYGAYLLAGPVVLTNLILKAHWGRARPNDIVDFGGDKLFTPAQILPVDQCAANCSFVSGEGSAAFAVIMICLAVLANAPRQKFWAVALILPMAILRIVAGGHFFSDVVFAGLFMAILFFAMQRAWRLSLDELAIGARPMGRDLKTIGRAILDRFRNSGGARS